MKGPSASMLLKISVVAILFAFVTANSALGQGQPAPGTPASCEATRPNGQGPGPEYYGNGAMSVYIYPGGTVVFKPGGGGFVESDGSLGIKWPWWRGVVGALKIAGRRLDAPAPPLRSDIPAGYGDSGSLPTALIFPQPGCWEITGTAEKASITFVTRVVKIGDGSSPR
jgi:hypothetical protein